MATRRDEDPPGRWTLVGWWAYLASAVAFLAGAIADGSVIGILASMLFLLGTLSFLLPLLRNRGD